MKRGMELFLVLNRTISFKSVGKCGKMMTFTSSTTLDQSILTFFSTLFLKKRGNKLGFILEIRLNWEGHSTAFLLLHLLLSACG